MRRYFQPIHHRFATALTLVMIASVAVCLLSIAAFFSVATARSTTELKGSQRQAVPQTEFAAALALWQQRASVTPLSAIRQIYGKQRPAGVNNSIPSFYVDASANPAGNGSQEKPFTNLTDAILAIALVGQGLSADIVVVPGTYTENIPLPPNTWLYSTGGYTDTVISGTVTMADGTGLFGFSLQGKQVLTGLGKDIVIAGNYFDVANSANVSLIGLYNAVIVENGFLAGAQVFGNGSLSDNFIAGGQFGLNNNGPAVRFEANVVTGEMINMEFSGSLSNTLPIEVVNNLVLGPMLIINGDVPYNLLNNTWLGGELELTIANNVAVQVQSNLFTSMQTALNVSGGFPQLENNLFFNNLSDYEDSLGANVIGINGNEVADPLFIDSDQLNFRLQAGSPAIDHGSDLIGITRDFDNFTRPCDGNSDKTFAWDSGAFEFSRDVNCRSADGSALPTVPPKPTNTATPIATATTVPTNTPTTAPTATTPPTATATETATQTATPLPTDTATATPTDTATATVPPTATATASATATKTSAPTHTATVKATATKPAATKTAVATIAVTKAATATANVPAAADQPAQSIGGPIAKAASLQGIEWYLLGDGSLVASSNYLEPFPLPKSIHIRSIALTAQPQNDLWAASDDGIYRRNGQSYRWSKVSDTAALHIAAAAQGIWITPAAQPNELWFSVDEGVTWLPISAGLAGNIDSPVHTNSEGLLWVATKSDDVRTLWRWQETAQSWEMVADLPAAVAPLAALGAAASFDILESSSETIILAGAEDGNLYQLDEAGTWQSIYNFGTDTYPLLLGTSEVALLDSTNETAQLYRGVGQSPDQPLPTTWEIQPTQGIDWVAGVQQIPGGAALARVYAWNDYAAAGFAQMALDKAGALYRFDLDPAAAEASLSWRKVTDDPEHSEFVMTHNADGSLGTFYSGATLVWEGSICTADTTAFYRSDDQGANWTTVVTDQARKPIAVLLGQPATVLAATCSGPELSFDGGETWSSASELSWSFAYGASLLEVRYNAASATTAPQWSALYAAGVDDDGAAFLVRASFDGVSGAIGQWQTITPEGLAKPTLLFASDTGNSILPLGNEDDLYIADANTVWASPDDGVTWKSMAAGLNGAHVTALAPFHPNAAESGMLAATNQGLLMGPLAGADGEWIALGTPWAQPADLQISSPTGIYVNLRNQVSFLPNEFLAYQTGDASLDAKPATTIQSSIASTTSLESSESGMITGTSAVEMTAMITDSALITESLSLTDSTVMTETTSSEISAIINLSCTELLINGNFEDDSGWTLPATAFTPSYSTEQVQDGTRSLRTGLPISEANRLSYSGAYQSVTLPVDASELSLSGQIWVASSASELDTDYAYIWFNDANGGLQQLVRGTADSQEWQTLDLDLTAFAGQTIQLLIGAYNDGVGGQIVMYSDALSLQSCK